ncbi:hypothetical protein HaLaN_20848 [Haematococcus lacustris]|uniref:Secreted protein n=1 Tax=Haematococcus lacustris TaxID=44745 RepID=A0A699ZKH3_HAELA|nr:hypothetical protein HaLaN_20848 [Haematococcus lacustris]
MQPLPDLGQPVIDQLVALLVLLANVGQSLQVQQVAGPGLGEVGGGPELMVLLKQLSKCSRPPRQCPCTVLQLLSDSHAGLFTSFHIKYYIVNNLDALMIGSRESTGRTRYTATTQPRCTLFLWLGGTEDRRTREIVSLTDTGAAARWRLLSSSWIASILIPMNAELTWQAQ